MKPQESTSAGKESAALTRVLERIRGRHVVGIWDTEESAPNLGGVLILLAELCFLRRVGGAKELSIAFLLRRSGAATDLYARAADMAQITTAAATRVRCIYCADAVEATSLAAERDPGSVVLWPPREVAATRAYESMETIQNLYEITGSFPALEMSPEAMATAQRWLDVHAPARPRIAVHLKMTAPFSRGMSNADMAVWAEFFRKTGDGTTFVLVGQDPVPDTIANLGNVVVARRLNASLVDELCVIRLCEAFMGMASGPCQIAIFGHKPYAVFKNPEHHPEEMARQMRSPLGFSFSLATQQLVRTHETPQLLRKAYLELLHGFSSAAKIDALRMTRHD